jgi:hypothetical protein
VFHGDLDASHPGEYRARIPVRPLVRPDDRLTPGYYRIAATVTFRDVLGTVGFIEMVPGFEVYQPQ